MERDTFYFFLQWRMSLSENRYPFYRDMRERSGSGASHTRIGVRRDARRRRARPKAAPSRCRLVGDADVAHAIGEAIKRRVAAEAEVRRARLVDRPAAFACTQLEQRAAAPGEDRNVLQARDGLGRQAQEQRLLADDLGTPGRALWLALFAAAGRRAAGAR